MKVLLTGVTGFIGRNIAATLVEAGHEVVGASRGNGIDFCQMLQPADWLPYLDNIDAVINSVGIIGETGAQTFAALHTLAPIALFQACALAGVRKVVQISALGADDTAFSAYHLSKRAADDYLRTLDLNWAVLRPSLIYGRGGGSAELFMRLSRLPCIPVIGDGRQIIQPVHISDVVATVQHCLDAECAQHTLDIVGNVSITFADWLQCMRAAQGFSRAKLIHIPFALAIPVAHIARFFDPILQPENLRMLQVGYRADPKPLQNFLGRSLRNVERELFFTDAMVAGVGAP